MCVSVVCVFLSLWVCVCVFLSLWVCVCKCKCGCVCVYLSAWCADHSVFWCWCLYICVCVCLCVLGLNVLDDFVHQSALMVFTVQLWFVQELFCLSECTQFNVLSNCLQILLWNEVLISGSQDECFGWNTPITKRIKLFHVVNLEFKVKKTRELCKSQPIILLLLLLLMLYGSKQHECIEELIQKFLTYFVGGF